MIETFYKAVRPEGTDFHTGTVRWLPEDGAIPAEGWLVEHPRAHRYRTDNAWNYLSVATVPTDCTGTRWPCRLLAVEPASKVGRPQHGGLPHKRVGRAWRVVAELPATDALGPQGVQVAALIERCRTLTGGEVRALDAAWDFRGYEWDTLPYDGWEAASRAAREAAWHAARSATGSAWAFGSFARDAARRAAGALVSRDFLRAEHYDTLVGPWESVMGTRWTR